MSRPQQPQGPGIGSALKDARRRIGMDVKEAEERTKIRAKYLRALEAEDWEVLPAPAYVRGFLRTYGALLGLDGELLADQFRRRHEEPAAGALATGAAPEPVLRERRRTSGSPPPSRGLLIAAIAAAIVVLLIVLGSIGGGGGDGAKAPRDGAKPTKKQRKQASRQVTKGGSNRGSSGSGALKPVDVRVQPLDSIQLCLVGDGGRPLIDAQVIAAGATEKFGGSKRYRLDLASAGTVKVSAGGTSKRLTSSGKASFEADSEGIREVAYAGPDCP